MLLCRLAQWHCNASKRTVKSLKMTSRNSSLPHALLGIGAQDTLLGHSVAEESWECLAIETLLNAAPLNTSNGFYRASNGAETDLVLDIPGQGERAVEIKRGLYSPCADIALNSTLTRRWVVYRAGQRFSLGDGVEAIGLRDLAGALRVGLVEIVDKLRILSQLMHL